MSGGKPMDEVVGDLLKSMNKGQYLLLVAAIRELGGELRIDQGDYARLLAGPTPQMNVHVEEGPITLRLM